MYTQIYIIPIRILFLYMIHICVIDVPEEEMAAAMNIQTTWKQLIIYSKTKDLRLIHIKLKFRDVTSKEDQAFRERLIVIRNEFLGSCMIYI